jgi:predicted RNase H-like nuclease
MKFLGIDLGWSTGASGLCCLGWQDDRLSILDLHHAQGATACLAWVDRWAPEPEPAVIAVDAPTLIPNQTGMRLADRLTHQHFRKYHAGSYPANLSRPFASHTIGFGLSLEQRGFHHAPMIVSRQPGRYQIEVFPHPAMVHLFGLSQIIKYKKGSLADRRAGLAQLRTYLSIVLPTLTPALVIDRELPPIPERGVALKAVEDQLDSLVCAYVAAHWWYWGDDRNWVLGSLADGYIVVPAPLTVAF